MEFSKAKELPPLGARYTLYPLIGTLDPEGACQLRSTLCGSPVPLRGTVKVGFADDVLLMVTCPVTAPTAFGSNVRVTVIVCPGLSVAGRLTGEAEKPVPATAREFTVTAAVPLDVSVTVCVVALFTTTPPNAMLVAFSASAGVPALSCSETARELLPEVAVSVTVAGLVTEATFAVNAALVEAAGTVTEPVTATAELLDERPTANPPVGADPDKLTVQESASDPVIDVLLHESALTVGAVVEPVPLRLTAGVGTLLEIVSCPVTELADFGSN
jgi:hypothetical protein